MIYNALTGISAKSKVLKIIPNAAHNLNLEAPKAYAESIK